MVKYVILPSKVKYDIERELSQTFDDFDYDFVIVNVFDGVFVRNYANPVEVEVLVQAVRENVRKIAKKFDGENDEIYMIASGSAFHNALVMKILLDFGFDPKILVFEKRVGKYAVVEV